MIPYCRHCRSKSHWSEEHLDYVRELFSHYSLKYTLGVFEPNEPIDYVGYLAECAEALKPKTYPYTIFYAGAYDDRSYSGGIAPGQADQRVVVHATDHGAAILASVRSSNHGTGARFIVIGHSKEREEFESHLWGKDHERTTGEYVHTAVIYDVLPGPHSSLPTFASNWPEYGPSHFHIKNVTKP